MLFVVRSTFGHMHLKSIRFYTYIEKQVRKRQVSVCACNVVNPHSGSSTKGFFY